MSKIYTRELRAVSEEIDRAIRKHGRMNSAHYGYAVLLEEVEELWAEVRRKETKRRPRKMRKEAIQIAATAIRFASEVCDGHDHRE